METLSNAADQGLEDCHGTLAFIKRFNTLIDIMNSKTPAAALWAKKDSVESGNDDSNNPVDSTKIDKIQVRIFACT
jgi:hypothetical protein